MLKKRIIKGIVLIIIGFIIYFGSVNCSEAINSTGKKELEWLKTYEPDAFSKLHQYGSQMLQYVNYVQYETGDTTNYSFFCNKLGTPPILINELKKGQYTKGTPDISQVASTPGQDQINPQIAYAMSIGILPKNLGGTEESWEDLQLLVWDAKRDTEQGSAIGDGILSEGAKKPSAEIKTLIPQEVDRFRKVYEEIFEKTLMQDKPLFKIENKQASLFVDQNDGTYIYGPFQLKINCDASEQTIQYLIQEIMQEGRLKYIDYDDNDFEKSEAYIENFYKFHQSIDQNFIENGISDGNKKKLKYSVNSANKDKNLYSTIIVDKNGIPIDFPTVNNRDEASNNFFIKFYPANEGAIINLGKANDEAELFQLKVKYGSYVNYTEHEQRAAFFTKGVTAELVVPSDKSYVIEPNIDGNILRTRDQISDPQPTEWLVNWKRCTTDAQNSEPIIWNSFLQSINRPETVAFYTEKSRGNPYLDYYQGTIPEFISGEKRGITFDLDKWYYAGVDDSRDNQNYFYCFNQYYDNLQCVGFSGDSEFGSSIYVPFTLAGESNVELTKATKSIKWNFAFPLRQGLEIADFKGIVKEEQEVTFSASGYKWVKTKDGYWDPDEDDEDREWVEPEYTKYTDTASKTMTIYRYRYVDWNEFTTDEIKSFASNNIIDSGLAPVTLSSVGDIDEGPKPTKASELNSYDSSYTYDWFGDNIDPDGWSVVQVYGGGSANCGPQGDLKGGSSEIGGFAYVLKNEGWFYDKKFVDYEKRVDLGDAVGKDHTWEYKAGKAVGEYDIWIPKDVYRNDYGAWESHAQAEYEAAMAEIRSIQGAIQSFISFGFKGYTDSDDIYKYGTKIAIEHVALPHLKIGEAFGGNVWKESVGVKGIAEKDVDGRYDMDTEEGYAGVKVDLYECDIRYKEPYTKNGYITDADVLPGEYLTSTFTDVDGDYRFYGKIGQNTPLINPLKKYYVKFVYNGQIYAQTLYNVETNSNYKEYKDKTSKAIDEYRDKFNKRFENIYADSNNYTYTGQRYVGCKQTKEQSYTYTGRAYGLKHVIQEAIENLSFDRELDTFEEQYNLFVKNNTHADFIDTTAEYEFRNHQPGSQIENQILYGTGEIVSSNIDNYWERPLGQYVDFNYSGLAPSVENYLRDCMIEASVPYTPDLTVYGKNSGMTNLKRFPEQATFKLEDTSRIYMEHYKVWTLGKRTEYVTVPPQDGEAAAKYFVPARISKYIGNIMYPEGTQVYIFTYNGAEYWRIVGPNGVALTEDIKVASLDDNYSLGISDDATLVGSTAINIVDDPDPGPDPGPGPGPDPGPTYYALTYLYWYEGGADDVKVEDHRYEPNSEHYINLYNKEFDLRHCWSFGVYQRTFNEVQLEKDLYKATMVVNGKKEVYSYSGKLPNEDGGQYNFEVGELIKLNKPLNGGTPYTREVRKSDYLYDTNVAYGDGTYSKNIKAYLTYKIKIHNAGPYTIRINEIADYYDSDNLEFDGIRDPASGRYQIRTHTQNIDGQITTSKYTYASNLADTTGHDVNKEYIGVYDHSAYANGGNGKEPYKIANSDPDNDGEPYQLDTIYIRGNGAEGIPVVIKKNGVETVTNEIEPSQSAVVFVTFKVKNNTTDKGISIFANQIRLDQITRNFAEQLPTIGKNNFAEINSYASYYTAEVPDDQNLVEKEYYRPYGTGKIKYGHGEATYLDVNNREVGKETNKDICIAGVVDVWSNPGSFTDRDVEVVYTEDGKYKDLQFKDNSYRTINRAKPGYPRLNKDDPDTETLPTVEPDMDKAPSIRIILDDDEIRKISGYVFEDARTVKSDGSPIGNGKMEDGETKINGVTVQLVELIQDVDYDGTFTGQYIGEKVWDECEYTGKTPTNENQYQLKEGSENQGAQYYSGKRTDDGRRFVTKYILNSLPTLTEIYTNPENNDTAEDGKYCFAGLPSGDFIVRFIYGDTYRTVLTNGTINNDKETEADPVVGIKETDKVNRLIGEEGLNAKSYNGQDFKSTVYQRDLASNSQVDHQVDQDEISYKMKGNNEVKGYTNTEKQDYSSLYNYNNNTLRTNEQLYNYEPIYYAGEPINNSSGNLQPSKNSLGTAPRTDISNSYDSMWRYDRVATANSKALSDANDLYGYRQRGIDYAQGYTTGVNEKDKKTLLNYRAEVLSSFERLTSQEYADGTPNKDAQIAMINELRDNTYMVAQTGIISMNNEYEGIDLGNKDASTLLHMVTGGDAHENHETNVDLGLVERPRAQVKLTKNVSNVEIKLADGRTLFNANTSMKNLMYKEHKEHEITYNKESLEKVRVVLDTQRSPELIKAEMDDEIMNGATINITYHLQVENVGEVDYIDKNFYFLGKKDDDKTTTPVTTKVVRVIDYVPNDLSYDSSKQNADANWNVYKPNELVNSRITENAYANNDIAAIVDGQPFTDTEAITNNGNIIKITPRTEKGDFYDKVNRDYVTRAYAKEVQTYNSIVVTKDMDDDLLPTIYGAGNNIDSTTLILTTSFTSSGNSEDLTYNNLAEVIETANAYGRRMQFSISGNQGMANQDINDGGATVEDQEDQENNIYSTTKNHGLSSSKIVQPKEIDADSAQEVQILPPTGSPEYRNKLLTIITTTIATIIVLVGAIIIKKKVYEK